VNGIVFIDERPDATTVCPRAATVPVEAIGGLAAVPAEDTFGAAGGAAPTVDGVVGGAEAGAAAADGVDAGAVASRVGVDGSDRTDMSRFASDAELPSAGTRNSDGIHPESLFGSRTQNHVQP